MTRRPNGCREITKGTGQSTDPWGPLPATAEALDASVEEEEQFRTVHMDVVWTSRWWTRLFGKTRSLGDSGKLLPVQFQPHERHQHPEFHQGLRSAEFSCQPVQVWLNLELQY